MDDYTFFLQFSIQLITSSTPMSPAETAFNLEILFYVSVSLDNILTPLICIMSGFLQQKLGPLRVLQFACLPYTAAWIAAALADSHHTLYLSRYISYQQVFILIINITFAIPIKLTQFGVSFSGVDANFQVSMERFISDCILYTL